MTTRAVSLALAIATAATVLTGCGHREVTDNGGALSVTPSATPTYQPKDHPKINAQNLYGPVEDSGMGLTYHFQGTNAGSYGGTEVVIAVTNNNDALLPKDALKNPELKYKNGKSASLLETKIPDSAAPLQMPLDMPLGSHATTNLKFTYDVSRGNLSDATLTLGNVTWTGNMAN